MSDEWHKQSYAAPPPYHVEHHGHAYIVCDVNGNNIAHTNGGAVLLWTAKDAETVRAYLETL